MNSLSQSDVQKDKSDTHREQTRKEIWNVECKSTYTKTDTGIKQTEKQEVERKEIIDDANGIDNDAQCSSNNNINHKFLDFA